MINSLLVIVKRVSLINYCISHFTHSYHRIQSRVSNWFRWRPTSSHELDAAENRVLSFLKNPFRTYFVDIGNGWGLDNNKIWTLEMPPKTDENLNQSPKTPLVLMHGFASAVGLWSLNLDSLSNTNRRLFAFDLLGFGKSSRPMFDTSESVELEMTESIERWRSEVGLEKFVLLGHSFGAYLAASYALQYPERVEHLILADPWGMPSQAMNQQLNQHNYPRPFWVKMVAKMISMFTPLAGLRAAGPWGPKLIYKLRPDLRKKFEKLAGEGNAECFLEYIYHCNAQPNPSGEIAFKSMSTGLGWARNPMIDRITELHPNIDITFIYGSRSWIDRQPGFQTKYLLGDRVSIEVIQGSGHHVYADKHQEFNDLVTKVCHLVEYKQNRVNDSADDEDMVQTLVD